MKKIAVVTGASSGFGYEFSKLLAQDSYDLILIGNNGPALLKVKRELEKKHSIHINCLVQDLSKPESGRVIYSLVKQYPIDILINNAGFGFSGYFAATNWKYEEEMIHLHVLTLTHLTKLVLADMISRRSGRIMNVSSVAAFQAGPLMAVYYATKAYILMFSEALANEVKGTGVTVTVFCPGQTATNFQKTVAEYSNLKLSETGLIMADPVQIAKIGYRAMMAGKSVCVPGMLNKLIVQVNRIIPRKATVSMVRIMQERIRK
jgi:short-subunit dehydrogenase